MPAINAAMDGREYIRQADIQKAFVQVGIGTEKHSRIISEKENPVCDVFWNNEFAQTIELQRQGLLQAYVSPVAADIPDAYKDPEGYWTAFGGRARTLLVNTDLVENIPLH